MLCLDGVSGPLYVATVVTVDRPWRIQRTRHAHESLSLGLLLSLLVHALLLGITFGGEETGLPGFGFPWQDRRGEVPSLRLVLEPATTTTTTMAQQQNTGDGPVASIGPVPIPSGESRPVPVAEPATLSSSNFKSVAPIEPPTLPNPNPALPSEAERQDAASQDAARQATARQEAVLQDAARLDAARVEAVRQEARTEAARLEAERQEAARQNAAQQDAARQASARAEATRLEAARAEATRLEAERQQAVQTAAQQEALRQEAARQEAERQLAAKLAATQQEAARQDASRQDAVRAEATRQEAARVAAEQREERLKAIGRQLNAEADRRAAAAAARQSSPLPSSWSSARRGRVFGRSDTNAELLRYAEAWSRKIELNMTFDAIREAAKQPHTDPLVTVAVRSDGSVESVSFVRSSGVAALDEAIRSVVQSQANYQAFQPALANEFDVIEIRRTWHFDMAIRLY